MKKTLNESTVRRFMKLASIDGLSENFVTSSVKEQDMKDTYEENLEVEEDEVLDLEGEAPLDLDPDTVEAIVDAVVTAIGDATGTDVTVSSTAGAVDPFEDDTLEGEAEDVFGGEQAVDVEDTEMELDVDELEEGTEEGQPRKTGGFAYTKGPVGGDDVFEEDLDADKPFTAKKEKPGEDIRTGAEVRGAEGTKKKTSGRKRGTKRGDDAFVNEEDLFLSEITRRVAERLMSLTEEE